MHRSYDHAATLADMSAQGLDIWCWCNGCYYHAVLSTDLLIARLGRDQGVPGVADHAYCGNCGSRDVETRPNWPTVGVVTQHSPAEHAKQRGALLWTTGTTGNAKCCIT